MLSGPLKYIHLGHVISFSEQDEGTAGEPDVKVEKSDKLKT